MICRCTGRSIFLAVFDALVLAIDGAESAEQGVGPCT